MNYTRLRVYLAMMGEQKNVTMIHTLGTFYSIHTATNAYQGKVMGFIGDRRATKEPTPVCLPQVKAWQWYSGQVNTDKDDFVEFFENEDNKNKFFFLSPFPAKAPSWGDSLSCPLSLLMAAIILRMIPMLVGCRKGLEWWQQS